ncbi:MAG: hypothetical protein H6Q73_2494 [Firmicutes bacterium]|nr:hypothetical protein [Bacillota bacterium]
MGIRPIDLQVLIPRSTEVSKIQQLNEQQNSLNEQQYAVEWRQISASRQQQVQSMTKSVGEKIDEKNREQDPRKRHHQESGQKINHREPESQADLSASTDPLLGQHVDIKT